MSEILKGMVSEEELLQILNLKPSELAYMRNEKGLPYVKLTTKKRVYLEDDLMGWFRDRRTVSDVENRPSPPSPTPVSPSDTEQDGLKSRHNK